MAETLSGVYTNLPMGFPGGSDGKVSVYNAEDLGSISGSGRSLGEGNSNPLQYFCLENPMDGGSWWATVHGVTKSQTQLSDFTFFLSFCPSSTALHPFYRTHTSHRLKSPYS